MTDKIASTIPPTICSTSYLTDGSGQVAQTLAYQPYGEDWVDIQNYAETRYPRLGIYNYNGKEKDYESGFHYYGARYYWGFIPVYGGAISLGLTAIDFLGAM